MARRRKWSKRARWRAFEMWQEGVKRLRAEGRDPLDQLVEAIDKRIGRPPIDKEEWRFTEEDLKEKVKKIC